MKRILFLVILSTLISASYAQKAKVASAIQFLKRGKISEAKIAIDTAILNPETKDKARTWFFKGVIYYVMDTINTPEIKALCPNPLDVAFEAFVKSDQLDPSFTTTDISPIMSAYLGISFISSRYFNKAVGFYNSKDFANASANFEKANEVQKKSGRIDTLALYNAAFSAYKAEIPVKAKELFEQLVDLNIDQNTKTTLDLDRYAKSFAILSEIYIKTDNDKQKAYSMISRGRTRFPNSFDVLIDEINICIQAKDYDRAIKLLDEATTKEPTNANLYYVKANMLSINLNEQYWEKDTNQYNKFYNLSEAALKKAIEVKPDYYDAYYNLGALYVNKAVAVMYVANKLDVYDTKYPILKEKADRILESAIPTIEKASELNPKEIEPLKTLKNIYSRLSMNEKLKEVNAKLEALPK